MKTLLLSHVNPQNHILPLNRKDTKTHRKKKKNEQRQQKKAAATIRVSSLQCLDLLLLRLQTQQLNMLYRQR